VFINNCGVNKEMCIVHYNVPVLVTTRFNSDVTFIKPHMNGLKGVFNPNFRPISFALNKKIDFLK